MMFWNTVKKLMKDNHIQQKELAEKLEIPAATITNWIYKDILPDVSIAYKIAGIFGVSVEMLMTGDTKETLESENAHLRRLIEIVRLAVN